MKRRTVIFGALSTLTLTQALRAASDEGEAVSYTHLTLPTNREV